AHLSTFPGQPFPGKITFIHPHLDEATRTLKVRIDMDNTDHELRPGMYSRVTLAVLAAELPVFSKALAENLLFSAVTSVAQQTGAGLSEPLAATRFAAATAERRARLQKGLVLAVPESAVVDTGTHKIVYRQTKVGLFDGVAVELGPRCGTHYPVIRGLEKG